MLVRSGAVDCIVVDSVAALVPRLRSKAIWATATSTSRTTARRCANSGDGPKSNCSPFSSTRSV